MEVLRTCPTRRHMQLIKSRSVNVTTSSAHYNRITHALITANESDGSGVGIGIEGSSPTPIVMTLAVAASATRLRVRRADVVEGPTVSQDLRGVGHGARCRSTGR